MLLALDPIVAVVAPPPARFDNSPPDPKTVFAFVFAFAFVFVCTLRAVVQGPGVVVGRMEVLNRKWLEFFGAWKRLHDGGVKVDGDRLMWAQRVVRKLALALRLDPEASLFAGGVAAAVGVFYWLQFYAFHLVDKYKLCESYKIQRGKGPSDELFRATIKEMAKRHVVLPITSYLLFGRLFKNRMKFGNLPSFGRCLWDIVLWHVVFDFYFYWSHRLCHHPALYQRVHKMHHLWTVPRGICAAYASRAEDILVNIPSTIIGPVLFPSHFVTTFIFICARNQETVEAHSGYSIPFWPFRFISSPLHGGADFHDFHHSQQIGNYGGSWFWDWLCGTDVAYRRWQARKSNGTSKADHARSQ